MATPRTKQHTDHKNKWKVTTFNVVVLHSKNFATNSFGMLNNAFFVKRLQGERIHYADLDIFFIKLVSCLYGFKESNTCSDNED